MAYTCGARPAKSYIACVIVVAALVNSNPLRLGAADGTEAYRAAVKCNAGNKKACEKVQRIALGDRNPFVRQIAMQYLLNEPTLEAVGLAGNDEEVCIMAVDQLKDPALLERIALEGQLARARLEATLRINDPQILKRVVSASNDSQVRSAATQKLDLPRQKLDLSLWKAATDPFNIDKLQAFLNANPNGPHAAAARQILDDERLIDEIVALGPGSRFVLDPELAPFILSKGSTENPSRGRTEINGDQGSALTIFGKVSLGSISAEGVNSVADVKMNYDPVMPCGERSVFVIRGKLGNIQGDSANPIRLVYLSKYGFVFLGGKGQILSASRSGARVLFQNGSD
jgi:hypothetical protein